MLSDKGDERIVKLENAKVIAVLRNVNTENFFESLEVLVELGINVLEVTLDNTNAYELIQKAKEKYKDKIMLGAGTVLNKEQVQLAYQAGAEFIISPHFDEEIVKETKKLGLTSIPGVFTPSEMMKALNSGADSVKIFPATSLGVNYFENLRGPFKNLPLIATGGINQDNAREYLNTGIKSVGMGSWLMIQDNEDLNSYRERIAGFVKTLKGDL